MSQDAQNVVVSVRCNLLDLYEAHVGKVSDKWKSYLEFYDEVFSARRFDPIRILEIGVQNGGSLEIWAKYFPNAEFIVGCEIAPAAAELTFDDNRISVIVGDANAANSVNKVSALTQGFDIIIDDGSHRSDDIVRSFALYFPLLRDGGLYIAEDLHCAYWQDFKGGIEAPFSSINFFKRLSDLVNREHWGTDVEADAILDYFASTYGATFPIGALELVAEVRFRNSLAMVTKGAPGANSIGPREVVGSQALVEPNISLDINRMRFIPSDQSQNEFGPAGQRLEAAAAGYQSLRHELVEIQKATDDRLAWLQNEIGARNVALNDAMEQYKDAENAINELHSSLANATQSLEMAQRRPHKLLGRLVKFRVLRVLAKVPFLPLRMRDRLRRSADKRNPRRVDLSRVLTPQKHMVPPQRVRQSLLRRVAFHRSGKPRGWFSFVALSNEKGSVRPLWHRAFYKKSGRLRPDLVGFLRANPMYMPQITELRRALPPKSFYQANSAGTAPDPVEIARIIFAAQQAELTAETARELIAGLGHQPLVSILMPVYKTPVKWLRRAVESLQEQYYRNWELCVVDDCSPSDDQSALLREMAKEDPRIRLAVLPKNAGISAASNIALEMAKGEFVALLDHDDEITPDALLRMVEAINNQPLADFLYSDECKIDDTSARELFHFMLKPDWSPEIMLNFMITGHLTVYRTDVVQQLGGFRSEYDFSQDYDLALRMAEAARSVVHVERILYLWRALEGSAAAGGKDFARETNIAALADALKRKGIAAAAEIGPHANRVRVALPATGARVSVVIPSDSAKNLRLTLDAIRRGTDYTDYEVLVVCNSVVANALEHEYRHWAPARFVRYDKTYNFSDKCNVGANAAEGDIVVFYNDDVFPIGRDWIERLIEYLWLPGVGATSPQLLYEDGTIQYAGMISGTPGIVGTAFHRLPLNHADPLLSMNRLVRNISVLSGACCAMRRDLFLKVGGFDAYNTPDGHSDVDLSYKIFAAGLRCVYTPYSLLTHIGNHSWNAKAGKYKADIFCLKRWGKYVSHDPYFTDTMKHVLYPDFTYEYRIYAEHIDPFLSYSGPDVLFVTHELTHTGAPHMVLQAARAVKAAGGFPVIVAPADGPLRKVFIAEGIVVIIDASVASNHFLFERFARNFDLAVVNTSTLGAVVSQLARLTTLRVLWWLHESQSLPENLKGIAPSVWERTRAICVGSYAKSYLPQEIANHILHNGLPDYTVSIAPSPIIQSDDKLVFLLLGTIEPRKGQDLFVEAILGLPEAVQADCRFVMAGKISPGNKAFGMKIERAAEDHSNVVYLGDTSSKEALALVAGCDVLVAPSRDDAFSLVAIEAAQMGKPTILSDHVGAIEVLDERCAFSFPSGDVAELRACIVEAHANRDRLAKMGQAARQTYEQKLTDVMFSHNFMALVESELAMGNPPVFNGAHS